MTRIAVCIPSRGLIHSRTISSIITEVAPYEHEFFWSHGLKIPDCFNGITQIALASDPTHLWFVEEDMVIPKGSLAKLLATKSQVATYDYPSCDQFMSVWRIDDQPWFCGTGCLLIDADLIRKLGSPWWRTGFDYTVTDDGFVVSKPPPSKRYGQHDVDLGSRLHLLGVEIEVVGCTSQYRVAALGESCTNDGIHRIEIMPGAMGKAYVKRKSKFDQLSSSNDFSQGRPFFLVNERPA